MAICDKRKPRKGEKVCSCRAYKFPHRFTGGKCTGSFIVNSTWQKSFGHGDCVFCNCLNEQERSCDVLKGTESIANAECFQEFVRVNEVIIYNKRR